MDQTTDQTASEEARGYIGELLLDAADAGVPELAGWGGLPVAERLTDAFAAAIEVQRASWRSSLLMERTTVGHPDSQLDTALAALDSALSALREQA